MKQRFENVNMLLLMLHGMKLGGALGSTDHRQAEAVFRMFTTLVIYP
jgi:hypothetical protein